MRVALGGSALDALKTFAVTGASTRQLGCGDQAIALELYCELPDKFVRRTDVNTSGPVAIETISRTGFNGASPISEITQRSSIDLPSPPPPPVTGDSPAVALERLMHARHSEFARMIVPMLAASPSVFPLSFDAAPGTTVDGRAADVVIARESAAELFQIVIDATSHLPIKVTWKTPPTIMVSRVSSGTVVAVRGGVATPMAGGPPMNLPPVVTTRHAPPGSIMLDDFPADPAAYAASLPLVQHEIVFSQFETVDGVTWPRRWKELADGKLLEDTRLGKFKINATIDPRKFAIGK